MSDRPRRLKRLNSGVAIHLRQPCSRALLLPTEHAELRRFVCGKQLTEVQSFTFPALSRLQTLQCPCSVLKLSATGDIAHRRHTVTL